MTLNQSLLPLLCALMLSAPARAEVPALTQSDLPRVAPTEATNVMKTFALKGGFELQVAAAEPNVLDPIEMAFDENGRLFVVEMRDYSEMREVQPHLGRIRMLEDKDGDGVYETATIYADDLPWPTGVICYNGGIFVAATPDLLYFKDTNHDGRADVRETVFTGYGVEKDKLNVQALVNCLRWGLDNRIHGQTAGNGGLVHRADTTNAPSLRLNGRDFFFNPRTREMASEAGGGQYGMSFDDHGRRFVCSNSRHIMTFMYDSRYAERNRLYNMAAPLVDIPADGPAAEVFRTSPEEAWRVIRTKWRVSGVTPGLIEGGGRSSGYFTGATGITLYRGDAWPEAYRGDAFTADIGSNLIHRKKVRSQGVELIAERAADEQQVEFLTSTDLWFRPAQMANAPDGCLYICDVYREVIEHPWAIPDNIKKLLDLNAGNDRGRLYRIAPAGFKPRAFRPLGPASTAELVATLEHRNAWHRETAARLLFERQDKEAVPLLTKLQAASGSPLARLHALHALEGLNALGESQVLVALNDADAAVREHAVKLAEKLFMNGNAPKALWSRLQALAKDPEPLVRYQLAFTLGELRGSERLVALAQIARQDAENFWTRVAIMSSLAQGAGEMFVTLSADKAFRQTKGGQELIRELVTLIGAQGRSEELERVVAFLNQLNEPAWQFSLANALGQGMQRGGKSLVTTGDSVTRLLAQATMAATDSSLPEAVRLAAIQLMGYRPYADAAQTLFGLLAQAEPQSLQLAALGTLARYQEPQLAAALLKTWSVLTPRLRAEMLNVLLARPGRAMVFLRAVEAGSIAANVLDGNQAKALLTHRDKAVQALAAKVLAAPTGGNRQKLIEGLAGELNLQGDAAHGKKLYEERCVSCHRAGGQGFALGPDLVTVKTAGKEKLLANIVDPNREVRPEFAAYAVETKDDESYLGLLVNETGASVTLRQAYGKEEVIPRSKISKLASQGQSLMPEGLEQNLTAQDMADLLEFVTTVTQ